MAPPIRCANDGIAATFRISRAAMACLRMRRSVCVGGMRQGEVDAFVFIGFLRSPEIEIREGNLHAMSGGKVKQVRSHDRVVADLLAMPVFEDQDGRRRGGNGRCRWFRGFRGEHVFAGRGWSDFWAGNGRLRARTGNRSASRLVVVGDGSAGATAIEDCGAALVLLGVFGRVNGGRIYRTVIRIGVRVVRDVVGDVVRNVVRIAVVVMVMMSGARVLG